MNEKIFQIAHLADQAVLYLLLTVCTLCLIMIVNRYFVLNKTFNACIHLKNEIENALNQNLPIDSKIFLEKSNTNSASQLLPYRYFVIGQNHVSHEGLQGLEELTESFKNIHKSKLEKYLSFMATVGSNSPYIGLFGTVLGIMKSFNDMAQTQAGGNGSVMAGISSALIATAAGLLAAIPAVLAYNYFQKQVKYIFETIDLIQTYLILNFKRTHHGKRQ